MNENVKNSNIGSISGFIDVVNNIEASIYRGMSNSSYSLTPKIGRDCIAPPGSIRSVEKFYSRGF